MENMPIIGNRYQKIEAFNLKNGLRVFYEYVPDTPLVSIQAWVNTGSADEPVKVAGISHLIEHMFFKGTSNKHIAVIAKEIEALGGYINAFTSFEETVFYLTLRNDYFKKAMDVLGKTIINPSFDENELKMEKEVVLDEIKRGKDDTYHTMFLNLYNIAYKDHPYGRPIIGYDTTVKNLTRDDIFAYYKHWYTPSNINLVIVGDVPRNQVEQMISTLFGDIKNNGIIKHIRPSIPEQRGQGNTIQKLDVKDTYYAMGFLTPPVSKDESFALEVLSYILGGNDTSRLPRIVRKENGLVDSISVYHSANRYSGFFSVSGTTEPEKLNKALDLIMNTVSDVRLQLPTQEELNRAKQMLKSMFVYDLETVKQRAVKIGEAVVEMGGLDYITDYTKKIESVTVEHIEDVIERYLNQDRLNISAVVPQNHAYSKKRINSVHASRAALDFKLEHAGDIVRATFENGMRIVVKEKHTIPAIALFSIFHGDMTEEPPDKTGLVNLMSILLKKGTHLRKESDIERESDNMSGMFSSIRTKQSLGITGEFLNTYVDDGLNLFSDMLLHPVFEADLIQRTKKDIIGDIKVEKDDIGFQAKKAFIKLMYGQTSLSLSEKGNEATIKKITRPDLATVYEKLVNSRNGVVAIVGDMDKMEMVNKIGRYLAGFRTGRSYPAPAQVIGEPVHTVKMEKYRMKKNQAHIITGMLTIPANSRDRFALLLLDQILGGQSGRLFEELRDKRGICYAVQTIGEAKLNNKGWFGIYMSTSPEKVDASLKIITAELERLYRKGIDDMELENSKRYILSDYDRRQQMALSVAGMLAYNELFDRNIEYYNKMPQFIKQVTRADINAVIKKYFSPDRFTTLALMPR